MEIRNFKENPPINQLVLESHTIYVNVASVLNVLNNKINITIIVIIRTLRQYQTEIIQIK